MKHFFCRRPIVSRPIVSIDKKSNFVRMTSASALWCACLLLLASTAISCGGGSSQPTITITPTVTTLRQMGDPLQIYVGAAADSGYLSESIYATTLGTEFSQLQAENEMKFALIHPRPDTDPQPYNFSGGDALVTFAQTHNMQVRGHTLVWYSQVPAWVTSGNYTSAQLSSILHGHITTVGSHYAATVYAWDVVNEAFNDNGTMRDSIWYDQPGIGFAGQGTKYIEQSLQWARLATPNAKLFYNDYGAETMNTKSDAIYAMAQDFKARGVPLNGIGFQMHVDLTFDTPANLASFAGNLQRFAALGLDVQITELDIRLSDSSATSLAAQAKLYGEITSACVHQSACKAIQTWGFTDKYSWIPSFYPGWGWALLWDASYAKKPAYTSVHDGLVR